MCICENSLRFQYLSALTFLLLFRKLLINFGGTDIGTINIGAVYVQEVLNKLTDELNESIFSIFQSVKEIQEGTYAFMAGGLADDAEAEKAITASRNVEEKTQEIRPEV